jgi:hypothetical protein
LWIEAAPCCKDRLIRMAGCATPITPTEQSQ